MADANFDFNLGSATIAYVFVMVMFMIVGGAISIFGSFRLRRLGCYLYEHQVACGAGPCVLVQGLQPR